MRDPKLLFDENLAARLVAELGDLYPGSAHVSQVALLGARDRTIWAYAGSHDFVVVTKDEDFHRLSVLLGPPPKVIWIRLGNCSTDEVIRLLRRRRDEIGRFSEREEVAFLSLA